MSDVNPTILPAYEVEKLEGTFRKQFVTPVREEVTKLNGDKVYKQRLEYEYKEVERGWMVFFPNKNAIHIETEEEMKRLGFDTPPDLVNMETGDIVVPGMQTSLKGRSEATTTKKSSRSKTPAHVAA